MKKKQKEGSVVRKVLWLVFRVLLCATLALVLIVCAYLAYVVLQYSRIGDYAALAIENPVSDALRPGVTYTALTYNIGFGAYDHEFSFFMDTGVMNDGTAVGGSGSRAKSADVVIRNTAGAIRTVLEQDPDFILLQEADVRSDRSMKIDQTAEFQAAFSAHASVFASNFHSAYLAYPLHEFHGRVQSGLLSLSRFSLESAARRSLPVDPGFPTRFFDLDRCFAVLRLPVEGGGELVLINIHMSAFDEGGAIRAEQMKLLSEVMRAEYALGNWVIVGGDFNHVLNGDAEAFSSGQRVPDWIAVFDAALLPEGFSVIVADNAFSVATCRSTDLPYTPGINYSAVVDGFIVSANVFATASNIDSDFLFSDHNPVLLSFILE